MLKAALPQLTDAGHLPARRPRYTGHKGFVEAECPREHSAGPGLWVEGGVGCEAVTGPGGGGAGEGGGSDGEPPGTERRTPPTQLLIRRKAGFLEREKERDSI